MGRLPDSATLVPALVANFVESICTSGSLSVPSASLPPPLRRSMFDVERSMFPNSPGRGPCPAFLPAAIPPRWGGGGGLPAATPPAWAVAGEPARAGSRRRSHLLVYRCKMWQSRPGSGYAQVGSTPWIDPVERPVVVCGETPQPAAHSGRFLFVAIVLVLVLVLDFNATKNSSLLVHAGFVDRLRLRFEYEYEYEYDYGHLSTTARRQPMPGRDRNIEVAGRTRTHVECGDSSPLCARFGGVARKGSPAAARVDGVPKSRG